MTPLEEVTDRRAAERADSFDGPFTVLHEQTAPVTRFRPVATAGEEIIVGLDGTSASIGALRQGAQLAESLQLPLLAICASGGAQLSSSEAAAVLSEASHQVFGSTRPDWFRSSVRDGAPAEVLGQASEHARMLVIGHRDRGDSSTTHVSVGSTIAAGARCPVVVFHATHAFNLGSFDGDGA